jgi:hypothetical protein
MCFIMHLHLNQDYEFSITIKYSMKKGKITLVKGCIHGMK